MSQDLKGPYKLGGAAFVVSGHLFLFKAVLNLKAGPPPSGGAEILAWIAAHPVVLRLESEILFFAAGFLVPAAIALYQSLAGIDRAKAAAGSPRSRWSRRCFSQPGSWR